jgi:hypothetical protein
VRGWSVCRAISAKERNEIDLSKNNVDKLVKALEPYTSGARKAAGRRTGPGRTTASGADRQQLAKIREWARGNGYQGSDRGRISAAVQKAYQAAN